MKVKPPKTVLSMRPQVTAGQSRGSIFMLLTKEMQGTCRQCGCSFTTQFPNQEFCSKKCQGKRARWRAKQREMRKSA